MTHDYSKLWALAPLWARWIATTFDGAIGFFEDRPTASPDGGWDFSGKADSWLIGDGADWKNSLQEIPERELAKNALADMCSWDVLPEQLEFTALQNFQSWSFTQEELQECRRIRIEAGLIEAEPVVDELDFIAHESPYCPVPNGTDTTVKYRDGDLERTKNPDLLMWGNYGESTDIIGYFVHDYNKPDTDNSFQNRVDPWLLKCFGENIARDKAERNHRFLEESLELVQSLGCTKEECLQLVDYVYGRPLGDPPQEVGGVMVTLAALCLASGLDMHNSGEAELARIWTKIEKIREKQRTKPACSPLPQSADTDNGEYPEGYDIAIKHIGVGYRLLKIGEATECGDEIFNETNAKWMAWYLAPERVRDGLIRRKVVNTDNGEGWVPEVGKPFKHKTNTSCWFEFRSCDYVLRENIVATDSMGSEYAICDYQSDGNYFEPAETPEQKAEREREDAVHAMCNVAFERSGGYSKEMAYALYDAGYRLKSEGEV